MPTLYAALDDRVLVIVADDEKQLVDEGLVGYDLESLDASPAAPNRVFAGTVESGLLRSTDAGESWESSLAVEDRVTAVTVSPHDPDVVWAGTEPSRVYRSTDGGESWTERPGIADLPSESRWSFPPRPHTHHVRWIAVDPRDPDRLYVAIEAGAFLRTDDGGETWQDHAEGARRDNHTIATHPDAPGRVYVAAGDGYAESADGGDTWTYPEDGLEHRYVWSVAVDPADPDGVVVSSASGAYAAHNPEGEAYVYRRTNSAWEVAVDGLPGPDGWARPLLDVHESPAGSQFVALTNHGPYRSDEGWAWRAFDVDWHDAYRRQIPRGFAAV